MVVVKTRLLFKNGFSKVDEDDLFWSKGISYTVNVLINSFLLDFRSERMFFCFFKSHLVVGFFGKKSNWIPSKESNVRLHNITNHNLCFQFQSSQLDKQERSYNG